MAVGQSGEHVVVHGLQAEHLDVLVAQRAAQLCNGFVRQALQLIGEEQRSRHQRPEHALDILVEHVTRHLEPERCDLLLDQDVRPRPRSPRPGDAGQLLSCHGLLRIAVGRLEQRLGGQRRQPFFARRIVGGSGPDHEAHLDERRGDVDGHDLLCRCWVRIRGQEEGHGQRTGEASQLQILRCLHGSPPSYSAPVLS